MIFSTATTSSGTSTLTMADIQRCVEEMSELFGKSRSNEAPSNLSGSIGGVDVRESINSCSTNPAMMHKRRSNQTDSYHSRIQKKWNKRFGMVVKPAAYYINTAYLNIGTSIGCGNFIIAHPSIAERVRSLHGGLSNERKS